MIIPLEIPDYEVYTVTKMPNLPAILDKAFKKSRQQLVNLMAHERQVFMAFNAWYLLQTEEQRALTMKNIKSTIPIDEIVDKHIRDRELIIEAIERVRANQPTED